MNNNEGRSCYDFAKLFKKKYPFLERELIRYQIYQEYIDHKRPDYWYIQTFACSERRTSAPYITIHFNTP